MKKYYLGLVLITLLCFPVFANKKVTIHRSYDSFTELTTWGTSYVRLQQGNSNFKYAVVALALRKTGDEYFLHVKLSPKAVNEFTVSAGHKIYLKTRENTVVLSLAQTTRSSWGGAAVGSWMSRAWGADLVYPITRADIEKMKDESKYVHKVRITTDFGTIDEKVNIWRGEAFARACKMILAK